MIQNTFKDNDLGRSCPNWLFSCKHNLQHRGQIKGDSIVLCLFKTMIDRKLFLPTAQNKISESSIIPLPSSLIHTKKTTLFFSLIYTYQLLLHLARGIFEEQSNLEKLVQKIMLDAQDLLKCEKCCVFLLEDSFERVSALGCFSRLSVHFRPFSSKLSRDVPVFRLCSRALLNLVLFF